MLRLDNHAPNHPPNLFMPFQIWANASFRARKKQQNIKLFKKIKQKIATRKGWSSLDYIRYFPAVLKFPKNV